MIVYTQNSKYVFDFSSPTATVTRIPNNQGKGVLRKDEEAIPLISLYEISQDADSILLMDLDLRGDGVVTRRTTSPIVRSEGITEFHEWRANFHSSK